MAFVQVLSEGWGWGAQMEAAELREDGRLRDEGRVSKRGTKDWEDEDCSMFSAIFCCLREAKTG